MSLTGSVTLGARLALVWHFGWCLRPAEGQTCPCWLVREKFSTVPAQSCSNQLCLTVSVGQIFLRDYVWNYFAVEAKMTHFVPSHVSSFPLF